MSTGAIGGTGAHARRVVLTRARQRNRQSGERGGKGRGRGRRGFESASLCSFLQPVQQLTPRLQDTRDAQKMLGHVDRKLVKQVRAAALCRAGAGGSNSSFPQTVMTSVYGVTFMGARDQISNRCVMLMRGSLTGLTSRGSQAQGAQGVRAPGGEQGGGDVCGAQSSGRVRQHVREREERHGLAQRVRQRHRTARCVCD